jgi:tetratricopeptide (TPR) repeat protein
VLALALWGGVAGAQASAPQAGAEAPPVGEGSAPSAGSEDSSSAASPPPADGSSASAAPVAEANAEALASESAPDRRTQIARDLFERGKSKWLEQQFEEAAALLTASQDQLAVPSTLALLADSYEQLGRLRSASEAFGRAALLAAERGNLTLEHSARTREAALQPRIPQLEIRVPEPVPVGLLVTLNGVEVSARQLNVPLAMDAGYYQLEARAPGFLPSLSSVRLTNDRVHLAGPRVVPVLLSALPSEPAVVVAPAGRLQAVAADAALSGQQELGLWLGAGGVAAAVTSGVVMLVAWSKYSDAERSCRQANGNSHRCPKAAFDQRGDALQLAGIATGFGLAGAALFGTGLALYLTPESNSEGLPAGAALQLSGTF